MTRPRTPLRPACFTLGLTLLACGGPAGDGDGTSDASGSDTGEESDTGEDGDTDEPELIPVERGILAQVYAEGVLRYVVHEISSPDESPLAWSLEPVQELWGGKSPFGSFYVVIGDELVTQELGLDDQGLVSMAPLLPPEVPQTMRMSPVFGPNHEVALVLLAEGEGESALYELRLDAQGAVSSARQLFVPPPADVGGSYGIGRMTLSDTHAAWELIYVPVQGDGDWIDTETRGVWGVTLDGVSEAEPLVELEMPYVKVPSASNYVVELVGDQLVYGDDPDFDGRLDLYTKPVEDPGAIPREICPSVAPSAVDTEPTSIGAQLLCTRGAGPAAELFHLDLDDPEATASLLSDQALGIAHTHVLDEDRLIFVSTPSDFTGIFDKGGSLMLVERIGGVWQPPLQISEAQVNADAGVYRWTYGLGGVVYAGVDGDASWVSWIDLSGPEIPAPVRLAEDLGSVGPIFLPSAGTRVVFSNRPDSFQLTSVDLSDPEGSRVELRELFPEEWLFSGGLVGLVDEGREAVVQIDGPKFLARVRVDGSHAAIQACETTEVYGYFGELVNGG